MSYFRFEKKNGLGQVSFGKKNQVWLGWEKKLGRARLGLVKKQVGLVWNRFGKKKLGWVGLGLKKKCFVGSKKVRLGQVSFGKKVRFGQVCKKSQVGLVKIWLG